MQRPCLCAVISVGGGGGEQGADKQRRVGNFSKTLRPFASLLGTKETSIGPQLLCAPPEELADAVMNPARTLFHPLGGRNISGKLAHLFYRCNFGLMADAR